MLTPDDIQLEELLKSAESSNAPLPDVATRQLRGLILCLHRDIDLINSTNSHPDSLPLHNGKSSLLTRLEAAVSPIRGLPVEIIGEILSSCISSDTAVNLATTRPLWNLTQICSVWRDVALRLPNLWNNIAVEFPCYNQWRCVCLKALLETFLSRTGNTTFSLDMSTTMSDDHDLFCQPFVNSVIDCIRPHIGRLRSLKLLSPAVFMSIMTLPSGMVEALVSVCLVFIGEDGDSPFSLESGDGLTDRITTFDGASNLREVTLISRFSEMHLAVFRFPWSQLTHLVVLESHVHFVDGHEALRQCMCLVYCDIGIASDDCCDAAGTLPPTLLPNLTLLAVHAHSGEEMHGLFLQPFILPSLQRLKLVSEDLSPWSELNVIYLIKRSKPMNFDYFHSTGLRPREVSVILTEFPLIKELSLCFNARESTISLDALVTTIARGRLAPNIQLFELEGQEDGILWRNRVPLPLRIRLRCHPREVRQGFWKTLVKLPTEETIHIITGSEDDI